MKPSLRDLFLAPDALNAGTNPLIRLGALRHISRVVERDQVRPRLEMLLREQSADGLLSQDPSASVFALHVAVALAQEGATDGIEWLLRYLRGGTPRHQRLGSTALRNCSQYPIAVLLGSAVAGGNVQAAYEVLDDLASLSDDQAWALAKVSEGAQATAARLETAVERLGSLVRPDRRLAFGTVLTRPVQVSIVGIRYTGFLVVEEPTGLLRAIPYETADLVNRDDGVSRVSGADLLREAGRRVLVSYDRDGGGEAQVLYVVPFMPLSDPEPLIARMADSCEGLSIGVAAHRWESGRGPMYRLVTSAGHTEVGYDKANRVSVGSCSLLHSSASRPFSTRFRLSTASTERIVKTFVRNTVLERCALLQTWERGYKVAGETGRVVTLKDQLPEEPVAFLEDHEATGRTFIVRMPLARSTADDRSSVLSGFFARSPQHLAVVVHLWQHRGAAPYASALIVNAQFGKRESRRTGDGVIPGTAVFWEEVDGKTYTALLQDQVVEAACHRCFGTHYRLCGTCDGEGKARCSQCQGTGRSPCGHCAGTGERKFDCKACSGTGRCGKCGGSATVTLDCKICTGTGRYADSGRPCKKCSGAGTFVVPCRVCAGSGQPSGKCPNCRGAGHHMQNCKTCSGSGRWNCDRCRTSGISQCDTCGGTLLTACACRTPQGARRLRPSAT